MALGWQLCPRRSWLSVWMGYDQGRGCGERTANRQRPRGVCVNCGSKELAAGFKGGKRDMWCVEHCSITISASAQRQNLRATRGDEESALRMLDKGLYPVERPAFRTKHHPYSVVVISRPSIEGAVQEVNHETKKRGRTRARSAPMFFSSLTCSTFTLMPAYRSRPQRIWRGSV